MSHRIGRLVAAGVRIGPDSGAAATTPGVWAHNLAIQPALVGGSPCFVMLHFQGAVFAPGAVVQVDLGYDVDLFDSSAGAEFWTRPIDPNAFGQSIKVTFSGTAGGVTLAEYGSGEPMDSDEFDYPVGGFMGSHSDPDVFFHNSPYVEPIYETRLKCHDPFQWSHAAAALTPGERLGVAAAGIIVMTEVVNPKHPLGPTVTELSSCSGTLIGPDLFLTARHCASDTDGADVMSSSVTFDYQTDNNGKRPTGYSPRWYKVIGTVASGTTPTSSPPTLSDWLVLRLQTGSAGIPITPCNLRTTPLVVNEAIFTAHHPGGAAKKFQRGTLSSGDVGSVIGFDYAGGSSGSALFDASGAVIGAALAAGPLHGNSCEAGYSPATSVTTFFANPPVPDAPWDVMIVLDRSGSMSGPGGNGRTKLREAQDAASLFVQLVDSARHDFVGLDSFSSAANDPPDAAPKDVDDPFKLQLVGSAPFTGGIVGMIAAGGNTSIGDGLKVALKSFPPPHGGSRRAILLLTDGLQNTKPMIADVEGKLGDTRLFVVGYGDDANLDGPLLTRLARDHGGWYVRADHGLALRKFFGLSFGNIFQSGALADPEYHLPAGDRKGVTIHCQVCDETELTAIVGWDQPIGALGIIIQAPNGTLIDASSPGVTTRLGATWAFLRVRLPYAGNREGTWRITVERVEAPRRKDVALDYFLSVIADGGPRLWPLASPHHIDVGDPMPIMVALHYPDRTTPPDGTVEVTVTCPKANLNDLVAAHGLVPAPGGPDPVNAWTATLQQIAASHGGLLPIPTFTRTVTLHDDGTHDDGAMEPDGIYANTVKGLTLCEGTYNFHAVARYGDSTCPATREAFWSLTVGLKDDPYKNDVRGGDQRPPRRSPPPPPAPRARSVRQPPRSRPAPAKKRR